MNLHDGRKNEKGIEIIVSLDMPDRPWLVNTSCTCRFPPALPAYLMCYATPPFKCNSATCNGACGANFPKFTSGYLNMADIFLKVPEDVARVFAGSLILNEGKVEGYYYGGISRHLDVDETKAVLKILSGN